MIKKILAWCGFVTDKEYQQMYKDYLQALKKNQILIEDSIKNLEIAKTASELNLGSKIYLNNEWIIVSSLEITKNMDCRYGSNLVLTEVKIEASGIN